MKKLDILIGNQAGTQYTLENLMAAETVAQTDLVDFFAHRIQHLDEHVPLRGEKGLSPEERKNAALAWNATYGAAFRQLVETNPQAILDYANGRLRIRPDDLFRMVQQMMQK